MPAASAVFPVHQRLVYQPRQHVQHTTRVDRRLLDSVRSDACSCVRRKMDASEVDADGLGGLERKGTREDGQAVEHGLLGRAEEGVAPIERPAQAPLLREDVSIAVGEEPEAIIEPGRDLLDGQSRHSGGRELQGQGDAVQVPADIAHGRGVLFSQHEPLADGTGTPGKQPDGVEAQKMIKGRRLSVVRMEGQMA